jgi:KaiC/GvpD/RAD55 family RecA-like ATPase
VTGTDVVITARTAPQVFAGLEIVQATKTPYINALIYGESGTGKTTLAGSADAVPAMRNVLFVDAEKGDLSLRKTSYRPSVVRVNQWWQLDNIYHALLAGDHEYQTVVVDSLNEINDMSVDEILATIAADPTSERDPDLMQFQDWNKNQSRILAMLRRWRDLPMNVIFTCLMKEDKDQRTGKIRKGLDLPPKLGRKVPAIFDSVFYLFQQEVDGADQRLLLTQKTENTIAKNRGTNALEQVMVLKDPSEEAAMPIIYNALIGA